ncbi:MAG: membrane integrity-associated transporter subunit PqiC [Deltaproteobacteria bacterium]|nr:membrane integrity-associated transporter subunit PqiC [Deltaproteobacteria bacterium]
MRNGTLVTALCLTALVAASCPSPPQRQYYGLAYSLADVPSREIPRYRVSLMIREPDILLAYDREQIVYRFDPFHFQYYHFRYWLAKPQQMIQELLYRHLKHVRLFGEVNLVYQRGVPDYVLESTIDAIEEYDSDDIWYSHLAMSLQLLRYRDRAVLWAHRFDVKKEVFTKQPLYVVRAMSEQIEEQMHVIVSGIEEAMAKEPLDGPGSD